ncbi:MAG: ABC transporter ATP-binding protein [Rhodospirillaceae bacterium]|nr:ABC transporter ATP-binding protein [Rhodospirillaceae bacterium]
MSVPTHLDLRDLTIGGPTGPVLDGYSAALHRGAIFALVSPDQSGLRALIDAVAGFTRPQHGRILLDGKDLGLRAPGERGVMTVRSNPALFPHLCVLANIAFPLQQRGHDQGEIKNRLDRLTEECGISADLLTCMPGALSAEQQLRVALARALGGEPEILLLERPLHMLAPAARRAFLPEVKRLHRQFGLTTLLATDDLVEAMALADTISVLIEGREAQHGKPEDLFGRPANAVIARLAGPCNLLPVEINVSEAKVILRSAILQAGGCDIGRDRCHPTLATGPAQLLIRPEVVRPFLGIRRFDMLADGQIADVMPRGGGVQIRATIEGFQPGIIADIPLPAPFPLEAGRRITLGWNRADAFLLPAD